MQIEPSDSDRKPQASSVMRSVFVAALAVSLVSGALANYVDPKFWGITSEPNRILYIGGLGLLAGFAGLAAVFSGLALAFQRGSGRSGSSGPLATIIAVILGLALLLLLGLRFAPR